VAGEIRKALRFIPPERLIVSSDCGFGRQGCNREIDVYTATGDSRQGCNIIRKELGLQTTHVPTAGPETPALQLDGRPEHPRRRRPPARRGSGQGTR
jgi:5-methyltetrahydropteroyltriglutamate--homocysteine methyltransferase